MPAPTTLFYDSNSFTGPVSAVTAGSVLTGADTAASPGTPNAWVDIAGNFWSVTSGGLLTAVGAGATNGWDTRFLARPTAEDALDQKVVVDFRGADYDATGAYWIVLRATGLGTGSQTYYLFRFGVQFAVYTVSGSTPTQIAIAAFSFTNNISKTYALEASAVGSASTTVTWTLYDTTAGDIGSGATVLMTCNATDNTSAVQSAGRYAIVAGAAGPSTGAQNIKRVRLYSSATASLTVRGPNSSTSVPANHNGNITLTLSGVGTSWTGGGTTFTVSGVSGVSKVSQSVTSTVAATVVISVPAVLGSASPGSTGSLTVSDGTNSGSVTVGTPTISVSPTSGPAGSATAISLVGGNTLWTGDAPTFTISGSGNTLGSQVITGNGSATATVNASITTGSTTITDPSTGATTSFTISAPAALAMGSLVLGSRTSASIALSWSAATGGIAPITYALYRNSSAPYTPPGTGTLVGTTSSLGMTDNAPGSANVYYRVLATDSASGSAVSTQSASQQALCTRVLRSNVVIGMLGDSITQLGATFPGLVTAIQALEQRRTVTLGPNAGVSGSSTADWTSGSSNLATALNSFNTANPRVTDVFIMLGTNDARNSVSLTSYRSNLSSTIAALVSAGYRVLINAPLYTKPGTAGLWTESSLGFLTSYRDGLSTLANGTTVFVGDTEGFDVFAAAIDSYTSDGVHPNSTGYTVLVNLWAAAYEKSFGTTTSGGGGGGTTGTYRGRLANTGGY